MRESIGGAHVLIISVAILLIMIVLLSASIGYTKAFKARNAIINIVQKHVSYDNSAETVLSKAENEIDELLHQLGYMQSAGTGRSCLNSSHYAGSSDYAEGNNYNYCIFRYIDENNNQYYGIETYMYFELPIFGRNDRFVFPIYGDTNTFFGYGSGSTNTGSGLMSAVSGLSVPYFPGISKNSYFNNGSY